MMMMMMMMKRSISSEFFGNGRKMSYFFVSGGVWSNSMHEILQRFPDFLAGITGARRNGEEPEKEKRQG